MGLDTNITFANGRTIYLRNSHFFFTLVCPDDEKDCCNVNVTISAEKLKILFNKICADGGEGEWDELCVVCSNSSNRKYCWREDNQLDTLTDMQDVLAEYETVRGKSFMQKLIDLTDECGGSMTVDCDY